jgi:hypothetical protein
MVFYVIKTYLTVTYHFLPYILRIPLSPCNSKLILYEIANEKWISRGSVDFKV